MASESKTAVVAALLGNTALALLKAITAVMTGSAAMLAERFHSLADTGNQILLFVGMRLSERPPEAMSLGVALHSAHAARHGRPLLRFIRETRDPTLATVLLEDSAALRSILVAVASFLAYENYSLLLGEPATPEQERIIRERFARDPAVRELLSRAA